MLHRVFVFATVAALLGAVLGTAVPAARAQGACTTPGFARQTPDLGVGDGPISVAVGDFNADDDPDLAVVNANANTVSILLNTCPPRSPSNACATPPPGAVVLRGTGATYSGTAADETIVGTAGNDVISGGGGRDTLFGCDGNDRLSGGTGNDTLSGGDGNDRLAGEEGDDTLRGGGGNDQFLGEGGNDALAGGPDSDACEGGDGTDTATGCEQTSTVP